MDFSFFQLLFFLDFVLQVALVAKLGDDIAVSIAGEDFKAAQDIGVVHLFEDLYFWEE